MDYKKEYEEAVKRAKAMIKVAEKEDEVYKIAITIFPELAESEDERIRKALIEHFRWNAKQILNEFSNKKALAWLEKQGEIDKESYKIDEKEKREFVGDGFIKCYADFQDFKEGETYWLEYIGDDKYNVRSDNLLGKTYHITPCQLYTVFKKLTWLEKQGEQEEPQVYETENGEVITYSKSKGYKVIEPKFKVGDWIIRNAEGFKHNTYLVTEVKDYYVCEDLKGRRVTFTFNDVHKNFKLWDITKDAKDGDVLIGIYGTFIFMGESNGGYCGVLSDNTFIRGTGNNDMTKGLHPATKEQRDALLKALADAGWEFDFEKKELKGIEKKSVSITDEWIEDYWQHHKVINPYSYDKGEEIQFDHQGFVGFCKKYCKKPTAWSEEDECYMSECIGAIATKDGWSFEEKRKTKHWLKSLKDRIGK